MKTNKNILLLLTTIFLLATSACAPATETEAAAATHDPAINTSIAATAQAEVYGTLTQLATLASPDDTPTPFLTSTLLPSATSSSPMISVSKETNCRLGPDVVYDRVGSLVPGVLVEVIAQDPSKSYYYIENPGVSGSYCWVWGFYATTVNDFSGVPVYLPGPTPTLMHTYTPGTPTAGPTPTGPTPTPMGGFCYIVSQTPADNTIFEPGQHYQDVEWVVSNQSVTAWDPSEVNINFVSGTNLHIAETYPLLNPVAAGADATFTLDLVIPSTAGTYTESWAIVKGTTTMCTVGLTIQVSP